MPETNFEGSLAETQLRLAKLERWEWWRWGTVFLISIALTVGVITLSLSAPKTQTDSELQLELALRGLVGLVVLFDIFSLYQQLRISSMRKELLSQIGMLSTLEVLRAPNTIAESQRVNRRKSPRFLLDQRLKVEMIKPHGQKPVFGRTRDISECGLGAVIADPLNPGDRVSLEFPLEMKGRSLNIEAVVCYRRGFHYGFEFVVPSVEQTVAIRKACANSTPA